MRLLALVLALVELGGVFGEATAVGRALGPGRLEIELTVEAPPGRSVVAHLVAPGEEQETVAMAEVAPGTYSAFHPIGLVDVVVVFEVLGEGTSPPHTLTALGLDPTLLRAPTPVTPTPSDAGGEADPGWGWLALGSGAGALSLLTLWWLLGRSRGRHEA